MLGLLAGLAGYALAGNPPRRKRRRRNPLHQERSRAVIHAVSNLGDKPQRKLRTACGMPALEVYDSSPFAEDATCPHCRTVTAADPNWWRPGRTNPRRRRNPATLTSVQGTVHDFIRRYGAVKPLAGPKMVHGIRSSGFRYARVLALSRSAITNKKLQSESLTAKGKSRLAISANIRKHLCREGRSAKSSRIAIALRTARYSQTR